MIMVRMPDSPDPIQSPAAPSLPLLHALFLLAGFGTLLLGPILPAFIHQWHLTDSQAGLLLLAQFLGATLGGSTVSPRLHRSLLTGLIAAFAGFLLFSLTYSLFTACPCLLLGGFGVGRVIATTNILAGQRYTLHRGSSLALLNFSWSLGALLSPLTAASLPLSLPARIQILATLFLLTAATLLFQLRAASPAPIAGDLHTPATPAAPNLAPTLFLYFLLLLFLYGGFETCLAGWFTTYATRLAGTGLPGNPAPQTTLRLAQSIDVLLLTGLATGRALAGYLLRYVRDSTLQRFTLLLATLFTAALALTHTPGLLAVLAILLGVALAPIFPATFAIVLARGTPARQAGLILAASGIGAAAIPWLMGIVSTRAGSLRLALTVPILTALLLLLATFLQPARTQDPA